MPKGVYERKPEIPLHYKEVHRQLIENIIQNITLQLNLLKDLLHG